MTFSWRTAMLSSAAALLLVPACSTSPPGGGMTNGEPLTGAGSEKAAVRSDAPSAPNLTGGESLPASAGAPAPTPASGDAGAPKNP